MPIGAIFKGVVPYILGAFSGMGKQGSQSTNLFEQAFEQYLRDTSSRGLQLPIEDPVSAALRYSLVPIMMQEFSRVQQPLIGEPEKAAAIQNIAAQTEQAQRDAQQRLASVGALDSGRAAQIASSLEMGRAAQTADFLNQIPFQNEMARREGLMSLFPQAFNLIGLGPRGAYSSQDVTESGQTMAERKSNQMTTFTGPGFWKSLAGGLAYGMQRDPGLKGLVQDMFSGFGRPNYKWGWRDIPLPQSPMTSPSLWPNMKW